MGWRDIISDMSRDEALDAREETGFSDESGLEREEVAEQLIARLQTSGIQLPEAFRAKAKRRIAEAARKGVKERKTAIMSQAGRQVERVSKRLRGDRELMLLAQEFMNLESSDALTALEQTSASSRNASPRLAAYLLLDAAL